jgi:spermidine/putrescine transport system substrate-binding protein
MAAGPWPVRNALSSSGELHVLGWADQIKDPVLSRFTATTGIRVIATHFDRQQDQIKKLTAGDAGFDLCQPALHRAPEFRETRRLAPFDVNGLTHSETIIPSLLEASARLWTWEGGLHFLPHAWGSEGISWRSDLATLEYNSLSYGTLWNEEYKGKVQARPHSLLLGVGLWLDAIGKLPTNRMHDALNDEAAMQSIYDRLLATAVEKKPWIRQFWDTAANIVAGFMEKGSVIGQTWDGPVASMKREEKPVSYMAPQEGAITWVDGWALTAAAANLEQAYAFLNYLMTPETSALVAETSRYNPAIVGAEAHMPEAERRNFVDAYPDDALQRLWFRPPEPQWFARLRVRYAERLRSA